MQGQGGRGRKDVRGRGAGEEGREPGSGTASGSRGRAFGVQRTGRWPCSFRELNSADTQMNGRQALSQGLQQGMDW